MLFKKGRKKTGGRTRKGKILVCPICKKEFYVKPSYIKIGKYCSYECMGKSRVKEKVKFICYNCKKDYFVHSSIAKWNKIREHKHNFCSAKCRHSFYTGENNIRWVKDRSKLKCRPLRNKDNIQWVNKVFKRDDYTCMLCKERGKNLEAHHVKRWVDYPELRFELSNGITLCKKCHLLTRGKEKNFEKRFKSYIKYFRRKVRNAGR